MGSSLAYALFCRTAVNTTAIIFASESIIGWRGWQERLGASFVFGISLAAIIHFLRWFGAKTVENAQAAKQKKEVYGHDSDRQIEIGEQVFHPTPLTRETVDAVIDVMYEPKWDNGLMVTTKPEQKAANDALYDQLVVLLRDEKGDPPPIEFLNLYLPLDAASALLATLHPGQKILHRMTESL